MFLFKGYRTINGVFQASVLFVLVFVFSAGPAQADWGPTSCPDTTVISSLPYTITSSGCYRFSGNLSAGAGSGLLIAASNVSVFFEGDTIWFGNSTDNNTYGVMVSSGVDSVYIGGPGAIISQAQVTPVDTSWGSQCIRTSPNNRFVHIDTLSLSANGGNAQCIQLQGAYGMKVTRCRMANNCKWYTDRCGYTAAVVEMSYFEGPIHGVSDFYHAYFENNVVDSAHSLGFRLKGVVKMIGNEVNISAVNLRYPTGGGICGNSSNAYCFLARGCKNIIVNDTVHVSEFRDNIGRAYDEYFGSDGMFEVENCVGLPDTPIVFINNKSYIHRGWDPVYTLAARGMAKIRPDGGPNQYLKFKYDSCWVYSRKKLSLADSSSQWSSYGNWGTSFYIIADVGDIGNVIESCYVRAITLLDTTDVDYHLASHGVSGIQLLGDWSNNNWVIRDNIFESNHSAIKLGYGDDGARNWDSVYNNNFIFIDTGAQREYLFIHCDRYRTDDNDFLDNFVTPDTVWDKMFWYGATPQNARIRKTLDLYVEGNNGLPVPGCSVYVWNNYVDSTIRSQAVASGVSDPFGHFYPVVTIAYSSVDGNDSLNTSFNDFRFKAVWSGAQPDSVSVTSFVDISHYIDTLRLPNTAGTGEPDIDSIPPGRVTDLVEQ
jgi:hypothetical protein